MKKFRGAEVCVLRSVKEQRSRGVLMKIPDIGHEEVSEKLLVSWLLAHRPLVHHTDLAWLLQVRLSLLLQASMKVSITKSIRLDYFGFSKFL